MRLLHAASMAAVASLIAPDSVARATTFTEVTVEDLARASDLVVIGRVEYVDVHASGPAGQPGIHTRAVVQVAETLRGEHRTIIEVWAHGGRLGNRMRVVPGQATFRAGEDVALFLFEAGGGLWPTGMGRGKWIVTRGAEPTPLVIPQVTDQLRRIDSRGMSITELRARLARTGRW